MKAVVHRGKINQGTELVFSPKLVQKGGGSFSPSSQFSCALIAVHTFFIKLGTQFHELVPSFTNFIDTVRLGMRSGLGSIYFPKAALITAQHTLCNCDHIRLMESHDI
jgi:hypothetical protein